MASEREKRAVFDRWAATYDLDVATSPEFPLAGYERALAEVLSQADVRPGMSALDLGTGTGNLAGLVFARDCSVWGTDFSPRMIERAMAKYPEIHFSVARLQDGPPTAFPESYDRIISAYAFHHLGLEDKVSLLEVLVFNHLRPGGRLIIADVAFTSVLDREKARLRFVEAWDSEEYYWAADETRGCLRGLPLELRYTQVSFCAGVFVVEASNSAPIDG